MPNKGQKIRPAANKGRVAVFEALERHGGALASENVAERIRRMSPKAFGPFPSSVASIMRGMQDAGWLALEQAPGSGNGHALTHVITEAVIVHMPDYFRPKVDDLRSHRGIRGFGPVPFENPPEPKAPPAVEPTPAPRLDALAGDVIDDQRTEIDRLRALVEDQRQTIAALRTAIAALAKGA